MNADRHFALLGAWIVAALQVSPLLTAGPVAARALLALLLSAALCVAPRRARPLAGIAQLALCLVAVDALSPLVDALALSGRAFTLLSAVLVLERGASLLVPLTPEPGDAH